MNFIAQNKELEMMNIYLKGLSKKLQENYNNKGKYLSLGKTPYILWAESAFAWGIFYVTRIKIIPFKIGIILLILGLVGFTVLAIDYLDILKDFKIPVISKKRFLKKNINNLKIVKPEKGTLSKTFLPKLVDKNPVSVIIGDILKDNDIINKVNRSILPVNTKLTVVKKEGLTSLGIKHAKVKILYLDDNTSNEIDVPILVNEANKQELNSVVNAAHKLIDTIVDLSDKSANSVSNYSLAKTNLSTKLSEASLVLANTLSTQMVINNMTKELARLGMDVINKRTALELTEAGKYSPRLIDDNKILLRQGSNINLDSVVKKIAKDDIPKNINYEIVNNSNLNEIGDINATIKVKYSDNSFDLINIPIRIYTDSKGESLKEEALSELVVSEKGESLKEEALPELVVSEKGESLKEEVLPELVVSEKGESLKAEVLPELVVSEKGEVLIQESAPKGKVEKINDDKSGVEVELFNNKIDNISLNVKAIKDTQQLSNISKELSVDKDKVRILDLKLSKDNSIVHLNNERIVRIALLENESSEIEIYHVDKTGKLTLIPSEVNNRIVQFNINHFSLFAIVDFSKKETKNKMNDKNYIESSSKKEYVYEKIEENSYTVSSDRNENKLTESYGQVEFDENSKNTSKVVSLNNIYKKKESLPKTGENSSEKGISLAGIGLMIGLLGIRRKYRSY